MGKVLTDDQLLLVTLLIQVGVMAALASILIRSGRFGRILFQPHRTLRERWHVALLLGGLLGFGVFVRILLNYNAADLSLIGTLMAGLVAGPITGSVVGLMVGIPAALFGGELLAVPMGLLYGLVGGGIHRACPSKEEIWHFSPVPVLNAYQFIKTWIQERKVIDWRTVIFGVCIGLEALRLVLSRKFGTHLLFSFDPHSNIALLCLFVSAISCLGVPLRIWGSARTEQMLKEQESLVLKARFEALRSQINPHFLFNTLNSIASSIRSNPDRAREIIVKLSRILRRLLSNDQDFVPLREELEFIDAYLDIEVIRFGRDKLRIHKAIDDGALDVLVPAMMLQPLVENAIRHGLAPKLDGGRIVLRAMRNGHGTRVEVEDNGVGISNERAGEAMGRGIGISNVNERLQVAFGPEVRLYIDSRPGVGTRVWADIPESGAFRIGENGRDGPHNRHRRRRAVGQG